MFDSSRYFNYFGKKLKMRNMNKNIFRGTAMGRFLHCTIYFVYTIISGYGVFSKILDVAASDRRNYFVAFVFFMIYMVWIWK